MGTRRFPLSSKKDLATLVSRIGEITPKVLVVQTSIGFMEACQIVQSGLLLSLWPYNGEIQCSEDWEISEDVAVKCLWSFAHREKECATAVNWRPVSWAERQDHMNEMRDSLGETVRYLKEKSRTWGEENLYHLTRRAAQDLVQKSLQLEPRFGDPDASDEMVALAAYEVELLYMKFLLPELLPGQVH